MTIRKFDYRSPRLHAGELRTPVTFYQYEKHNGPEPGEKEKKVLFKSWAKIDEMWLKDMELAKSEGTESDVTIIIRDPLDDYIPTNKHYVSIDDRMYRDNRYNIKHVQPDVQDRNFINIVAGIKNDS